MRRRSKIALGILVLVIMALLALQTPLLRKIRISTWSLWVQSVARVFSVGPLNISQDVATQVRQLTSENVRLRAQQADYVRLKEQLGSPSFESYRIIPGEIVSRTLDTFQVQLVINRGAKDGVIPNAPVVVYGSTLIGFVTAVAEHASTVQLLLHPSTSLAVEVLAENTPRGLLIGRQYTSLRLTTIPRDSQLQSGNDVVSVAREGLPYGLLIGRIGAASREENAAYQEAVVTLPYDPDKLRAVSIIVLP